MPELELRAPCLYIDARRKGNTSRLINSSCDPNCETQKWHDASTGEVRVGIFATRDIPPGEELVYDYFFSTYGVHKHAPGSFMCMCGSKNCRMLTSAPNKPMSPRRGEGSR
ncbi:Histone-lysine N-methyltransferase SETD2 [Tetrabaena socialis]|uniref:Histone-lysine N-methyltransferase SETD2 n=1 Tax=Tetrabaena socialis TaxID=47790 RepID=A0A2J7ZUC2_9CHLO|nr:Histone-lysine N-methyltransferase SETD2 [Tetrabaena socialis]|eukprot:PNH03875.1 Histone-lysine N-methyltransferase SETD2 [Tetrabaena socialis]